MPWFTVHLCQTDDVFDRTKGNFARNLSNGRLLFSALEKHVHKIMSEYEAFRIEISAT